jgi:hypothetical protein
VVVQLNARNTHVIDRRDDTISPNATTLPVEDLAALGTNLERVWFAPGTDAKLRKRIVRTVIREVVANLDDDASEIVLLVHWAGSAHTEIRLPKRQRGQRNATPPDIVEAVRQLARIASDAVIAGVLKRNGLSTGNGNRWTKERVTALRSYRKIPVFKAEPNDLDPWLNLSRAAKLLGVAPKTLRLAAEAGDIKAERPLADGPWIFERTELSKPAARQLNKRVRHNRKHPTVSHPNQQNLFSSTP